MPRTVGDDTGRRYGQLLPDERRAERRRRLLDAGLAAFAADGFAGVTIERLCSSARVSTRGFYEEFVSKEDLLGALHDDLNAAAEAAVVRALADVDPVDVAGRARAGLAAYFEAMTGDPRHVRVVLVEAVGVSPAMEARRQRAVDRFTALLAAELDRLAAAGALVDRDRTLTVVAVVGAIKELLMAWASGAQGHRSVTDLVDEATAILLAAVDAR